MIRLDIDEKFFLDKIKDYYRLNRATPLYVADIGAASGSYMRYMKLMYFDFELRFVVAEPVPMAWEKLHLEFKGDPTIDIKKVAFTNKVGVTYYDINTLNSEHSGIIPINGAFSGTKIKVDTTTVDSVFGYYQKLHLLKIDVEGEELPVLWGASQLLDSSRIDFIQLEYGGGWEKDQHKLEEGLDYLESKGYTVYECVYEWGSTPRLVPARRLNDYLMRNLLAVNDGLDFHAFTS
jgi:FkbM family methyltransferase